MATPLAEWGNDNSTHDKLVWWSRLDKRFQIEVVRTGAYTAELVIFDHDNGDKELLRESVGLSYGALFGPDAGDVAEWQDRAIQYIDNELPKKSPE